MAVCDRLEASLATAEDTRHRLFAEVPAPPKKRELETVE
jgi:hypothetical protein